MPESSPQLKPQQPKPIAVLRPPLAAAGYILVSISFCTFLWGIFARIPEKVYGTGVLLSVDSTLELKSLVQGTVVYPVINRDGKTLYNNDRWGRDIYQFARKPESLDNDQVLKLAKHLVNQFDILDSSTRMNLFEFSGGEGTGASKLVTFATGDILARIENDVLQQQLQEALFLIRDSRRKFTDLVKTKTKLLADQKKILENKRSLVDPVKSLHKLGYTSTVELLRTEADAVSESLSISNTESSIQELKIKISQAESDLRKLLYSYVQQSFLIAEDDGYVNAFRAAQWSNVSAGQSVLQLRLDDEPDNYIIPLAVDQVTAGRIAPGMKAILTPLGLNPSEVGGMVGEIVGLESDPVELSTLATKLGSPGLASLLEVQKNVAYIAYVKLKINSRDEIQPDAGITSDTRGRFQWNNRSRPPLKPREGILLSAQITTRERSPVEMILPTIAEIFGQSTPAELVEKSR